MCDFWPFFRNFCAFLWFSVRHGLHQWTLLLTWAVSNPSYVVYMIYAWRAQKMDSPTTHDLVRIVVPCAQTRLPGPRGPYIGHRARDAFSSSSERRKHHVFQQACSAGHWASSEARGDVRSLSWSGGRFDILTLLERRHCTVNLSSCSWPAVRVVYTRFKVWCCFHLRMRTVLTGTRSIVYSMLLVMFSHIIPWLWYQTYLFQKSKLLLGM